VPFNQTVPVSPLELVTLSDQQINAREAELFLRGLSPGIPALGIAQRAWQAAQGRRISHPAFDRETSRRYARELMQSQGRFALRGEQQLRELLRVENGLRGVGAGQWLYLIGKRLDQLIEADRYAALEKAAAE
jgi:hypothetical protein